MSQAETQMVIVSSVNLTRCCTKLLIYSGLNDSDAELASSLLVETNLRGVDSHGVARLPHYIRRIKAGSILPKPEMRFTRLSESTGILDGGHGLGHVVMTRATQDVITIAQECGSGWVAVKNSSHCGALAGFGLPIAAAGMIGLVFSHVDPMVLPYGGRKPFCGTNPICITAPAKDKTLCLDMATSKVAWNRVGNAAMNGETIPFGWAVDSEGRDITDPTQVAALFPFGEYKGSGLGLCIDVLCALLSGAPFGPDVPKMYGDLSQHRHLGGMVGAIDIRRFVLLDEFTNRLTDMLERWGAIPPMDPGDRVLYPGEPEVMMHEKRLREGIPLPISVLDEFQQTIALLKISDTLESLLGIH